MQAKTILLIALLLGAVFAIMGCTSAPQAPAAAPAATAAPAAAPAANAPVASAPAASSSSLQSSPTDAIIPSRQLTLDVEKDYLGKVTVTFQGGAGNGHVNSFQVTVNRADGQVQTGSLGTNLGDTVTLQGTKDTDRVIVQATMDDGKTYKVIDTQSKYRTIG